MNPDIYRPEATVTYFGKKFQTKIITHLGYKRIIKFLNSTQKKVKDEIKLSKNHPKDCPWCA